jgi:hypothetical protein
MIALVHPVDCVEKLRLARAEGDELVTLEKLEVLQASLHEHHAVLGPLVLIPAYQRDQPLLVFFCKLGAILGLIRRTLHRVGRRMLHSTLSLGYLVCGHLRLFLS